jgi:hypothetical protein
MEIIPESPLRILLFLFSVSKSGGECEPGFSAIERHTGIKEKPARNALRWLDKKGWIFDIKRAGPYRNQRIYIQIPNRLKPAKASNIIATKARQFKVVNGNP